MHFYRPHWAAASAARLAYYAAGGFCELRVSIVGAWRSDAHHAFRSHHLNLKAY